MNRPFKNKNWYDGIRMDTIFFKIKSPDDAAMEILDFIKDGHGDLYYDEGSINYTKTKDPKYIIKGLNVDGIMVSSGGSYTEANRYSDLLEEEELIDYLIKRIRISIPCVKTLINLNNIVYYHFLKDMSYNFLKENMLYDKNITSFKKDKKIAWKYIIHAFQLDLDGEKILKTINKLEEEILDQNKLILKKISENSLEN